MAVTSGDTMVQLASSASFIGERGSMFWAVPESLRPTCHSSVQLYLYAGKNKLPQTVVDAISASDRRLRNHDGQLNSRRLMKPSTTAPSGEEAEEERKESLPTTMLPRNLINAFPFSERRVALWVEADGVFKCLEWPAEQAGDETGYPRRLDPGYGIVASRCEKNHKCPWVLFSANAVYVLISPFAAALKGLVQKGQRKYERSVSTGFRELYIDGLSPTDVQAWFENMFSQPSSLPPGDAGMVAGFIARARARFERFLRPLVIDTNAAAICATPGSATAATETPHTTGLTGGAAGDPLPDGRPGLTLVTALGSFLWTSSSPLADAVHTVVASADALTDTDAERLALRLREHIAQHATPAVIGAKLRMRMLMRQPALGTTVQPPQGALEGWVAAWSPAGRRSEAQAFAMLETLDEQLAVIQHWANALI